MSPFVGAQFVIELYQNFKGISFCSAVLTRP